MKVITLRQPWASLVAHGFKKWETRGWKPSVASLRQIEKEGLCIHAGASLKDAHRMGEPPFSKYVSELGRQPYSGIIAHVHVGRIMTTEQWLNENCDLPGSHRPDGESKLPNEYFFGDYSPGRWAWELLDVAMCKEPIPCRGSLGIWNYPSPFKFSIHQNLPYEQDKDKGQPGRTVAVRFAGK